MDTKTTLEEMDRKALTEIKTPQHQAVPQKKEERLFPALFITEDLKAVVGMDETLKGYMKDLKETDSTLSQTMMRIEKLRSDYTSFSEEMDKWISAMKTRDSNLLKILDSGFMKVIDRLSSIQSHLQEREETIINQTSETQQLISSLGKALSQMTRALKDREKIMRRLLRIALIPASVLVLLIVADIILRIVFQ